MKNCPTIRRLTANRRSRTSDGTFLFYFGVSINMEYIERKMENWTVEYFDKVYIYFKIL